MTIYNKTEFTPEIMKKFARRSITILNKMRWFFYICAAFMILSTVIGIVASFFFPELWKYSAMLLVIDALFGAVIVIAQKKVSNSYRQRGITGVEYKFSMSEIKVSVHSEKINMEESYSTEMIEHVWETKDVFYIRVAKIGFLIVSKAGFEPGEDVHLRKVLWELVEPRYDVLLK